MYKKIIFVLVSVLLFFSFKISLASVIINEVQIGGVNTDDEFIEIYNSGSSEVDLTDWYINKKSSSGSESTILSKSHFKDKSILGNSYLLLAKENGYTGNGDVDIFWPSSDSYGLAKNNSLVLCNKDCVIKDQISWENIENNKSFQKTSSGWIVANPTPKEPNENADTSSSESNSSSDDTDSDTSKVKKVETKTKKVEIPTMKAKILAETLAFSEQLTSFSSEILGYSDEKIVLGKMFWNFGDGSSLEQVNKFEKIYHTYLYPGEYSVSMEYYPSLFSKEPEISSKMIVKVVPADIVISNIGNEKDYFIELSNNSNYDVNISGWIIRASQKYFIFPKNSIIMSKNKLIISGKITGFTILDNKSLGLFSSNGKLVFDYYLGLNKNYTNSNYKASSFDKTISKDIAINESYLPEKDSVEDNLKTENEDILKTPASLILADSNNKNPNTSYLFFWIFVFLLIISVVVVYYIRKNKVNLEKGDDFDILDE